MSKFGQQTDGSDPNGGGWAGGHPLYGIPIRSGIWVADVADGVVVIRVDRPHSGRWCAYLVTSDDGTRSLSLDEIDEIAKSTAEFRPFNDQVEPEMGQWLRARGESFEPCLECGRQPPDGPDRVQDVRLWFPSNELEAADAGAPVADTSERLARQVRGKTPPRSARA
jgi:hypothetical protein